MAEVSVILPTYNRAHLLKRSLDSVLIQKDVDWELIIVDDGSDDASENIYKETIEDSRIKIFRQTNKGVSAARNKGVAESTGKYLAFIDSDDEWMKGKLRAQLDFAKSSPFVIHQTCERWIRRGVRVNPPRHSIKQGGDIFKASLARCMITPSSVFLTRDLFEEMNGFDESYPACEDYELWLRITSAYSVGLLNQEYLIRYGGHEDQLSARYPAMDVFRIKAMDKFLRLNDYSDEQKVYVVDVLLKKLTVYCKGCAKRGKLKEVAWCEGLLERWG